MAGNPRLAELGFGEEALGHNAILAGFQGQRQWTDYQPNGDFLEAILNTSFDWNGIRQPYLVATENDSLNGVSMLFGHLLTNTASIFADVRTYWSPAAVKRVTGYDLERRGRRRLDPPDQFRRGHPGRHRLAGNRRPTGDETLVADQRSRGEEMPGSHHLVPGQYRLFPRRRLFLRLPDPRRHARDHGPPQPGQGSGPGAADGRRLDGRPARRCPHQINERTDPTWPTHYFVPNLTGQGAFSDVYSVMANWGANHGALSYGHIGADLIALASMLRIPVCMHNVPAEKIFRPSTWSAFGTADREAADYRACAAFGPLYG